MKTKKKTAASKMKPVKKKVTKKVTKTTKQKTTKKMSQSKSDLPKFETIQQAQEALAQKKITLQQFHEVQEKLNSGSESAAPSTSPEHPGEKMIKENAARAKKMVMPSGDTTAKTEKEPKAKKVEAEYDKEAAKKICDMDCKKHYRMFLLSKMGLSRKQIAALLTTNMNVGQVGNALKLYSDNPQLESEMANKVAEAASKPKPDATAKSTEVPEAHTPESEATEKEAAPIIPITAAEQPTQPQA